MLRISTAEAETGATSLRIEGRLAGQWVDELKSICSRLLDAGKEVTLDLTALAFVDRQGSALLVELRSRGVALANASPFVREQLARNASLGGPSTQ